MAVLKFGRRKKSAGKRKKVGYVVKRGRLYVVYKVPGKTGKRYSTGKKVPKGTRSFRLKSKAEAYRRKHYAKKGGGIRYTTKRGDTKHHRRHHLQPGKPYMDSHPGTVGKYKRGGYTKAGNVHEWDKVGYGKSRFGAQTYATDLQAMGNYRPEAQMSYRQQYTGMPNAQYVAHFKAIPDNLLMNFYSEVDALRSAPYNNFGGTCGGRKKRSNSRRRNRFGQNF